MWREFCRKQKSTLSLTRTFASSGLTGEQQGLCTHTAHMLH